MKNNQELSKVILAPNHNFLENHHMFCFEDEMVVLETSHTAYFEPQMLDWPIMFLDNRIQIDEEEGQIYRHALEALTQISPFKSIFSLKADLDNKGLILTKRTWGHIFLNDVSILSFSHDSRKDNSPFVSIFDWVEMGQNTPYKNYDEFIKENDLIVKTLYGWSIDDWVEFFKNKIKDRAIFFNRVAQQKKDHILSLESQAKEIFSNLS
jgi:hypothetical protein